MNSLKQLATLFVLAASAATATAEPPTLHADVPYGEAAGEKLLLDASEPAGAGPFPVAIYIHGGGWQSGDKASPDDAPMRETLTQAGLAWFSINYRLAPKHAWPACLDDVQTAIRWVKANAATYKGDPARIGLVGYSAGGHLAAFASTIVDDTIRVQAVVGCAPPADFVAELPRRGNVLVVAQRGLLNRPEVPTPESLGMLRAISPINHVRPGMPPFLIIQGDKDKSVLIEETRALIDKLKANDVPCDVITLPGAPHRQTEWIKFAPDYQTQVAAWLQKTLASQPPAGSAAASAK